MYRPWPFWFLLLAVLSACSCSNFDFSEQSTNGYVNVRSNAHMFWWFFYASKLTDTGFIKETHPEDFPIILWLQGGPGGSSTGFGNFELIGPLDDDLNLRNSSWIQHANLLFIDSPVGTGYSYVTEKDAFATNNDIIATDLVVLLEEFFFENPSFRESPIYLFSESYGGKMAVSLAIHLSRAIENKMIRCNLKGLVLGDPWISPLDSVSTWPQYLKSLSLLDEKEFEDLTHQTKKMKQLLDQGQFVSATKHWSHMEAVIRKYAFNVDFYHALKHKDPFEVGSESFKYQVSMSEDPTLIRSKLREFYQEKLDDLMNMQIRKTLDIPSEVVWGSQIRKVFDNLRGDFMRPVLEDVNYILNNLPIKVVVYNGQWDLIVNILGTTNWVNRLKYPGVKQFKASHKKMLLLNDQIAGFYKEQGNFSFYWIHDSGHMVPRDAPETALMILKSILPQKLIKT